MDRGGHIRDILPIQEGSLEKAGTLNDLDSGQGSKSDSAFSSTISGNDGKTKKRMKAKLQGKVHSGHDADREDTTKDAVKDTSADNPGIKGTSRFTYGKDTPLERRGSEAYEGDVSSNDSPHSRHKVDAKDTHHVGRHNQHYGRHHGPRGLATKYGSQVASSTARDMLGQIDFEDAARDEQDPHYSTHRHRNKHSHGHEATDLAEGPSRTNDPQKMPSSIVESAQELSAVKSPDVIFGDVISATVSAVATLTDTAEATSQAAKQKMPLVDGEPNMPRLNDASSVNQDQNSSHAPSVASNSPANACQHRSPTAMTASASDVIAATTAAPGSSSPIIEDILYGPGHHSMPAAAKDPNMATQTKNTNATPSSKLSAWSVQPEDHNMEDPTLDSKLVHAVCKDPVSLKFHKHHIKEVESDNGQATITGANKNRPAKGSLEGTSVETLFEEAGDDNIDSVVDCDKPLNMDTSRHSTSDADATAPIAEREERDPKGKSRFKGKASHIPDASDCMRESAHKKGVAAHDQVKKLGEDSAPKTQAKVNDSERLVQDMTEGSSLKADQHVKDKAHHTSATQADTISAPDCFNQKGPARRSKTTKMVDDTIPDAHAKSGEGLRHSVHDTKKAAIAHAKAALGPVRSVKDNIVDTAGHTKDAITQEASGQLKDALEYSKEEARQSKDALRSAIRAAQPVSDATLDRAKVDPEPELDFLSSTKYFGGAIGDTASELIAHTAEIAPASLRFAKNNATSILGAAKNELIHGSEALKDAHHHDKDGWHEELRDIKGELEQEAKEHKGIADSNSKAARKADEVALQYYSSLGGSSDCSNSDSAESDYRMSRMRRKSKVTLDHETYVFRDVNGDPVDPEDLQEYINESTDDERVDTSHRFVDKAQVNKGQVRVGGRGLFYAARAAAARMASRVARAMVGSDSAEEDDDQDEGAMNRDSARYWKTRIIKHSASTSSMESMTKATGNHWFKPSNSSHNIDKSGFIAVEDPRLIRVHEREFKLEQMHESQKDCSDGPIGEPIPALSQDQQERQQTPHGVVTKSSQNPASAAHVLPMHKRTILSGGVPLSYSAAAKMNLTHNDHGVRVGVTETHSPALGLETQDYDYVPTDSRNYRRSLDSSATEYVFDEHGLKTSLRDERRDPGFKLHL
ncbi:hypothetical protein BGZ99_009003 [Dissophora globulifera]|uniref:Uncharacterized protein n=1 Tax=Dissophora globulifera TaxID=979702 RepID=A0A9P6RA29_9FUNG|nr:hypothetical protein BGZ99_009003 [Dissophora globulifera]